MQTLRKKTSPLKFFSDKNETTKFLGDGVSFKAKLIGILEVSEARGDRMCQEALSDLKMAIRAAGEHKQRITVNIAIDGLRLRDEKTGDCLYHHPVHKISFIAQDMTDSRAFGYIFGSPDTGHRFFGIKTDKAASQVVIAMRDLFQVVFSLKKKEIELAKQHLEKNLPHIYSEASAPPKVLEKSRSDTKGLPSTSDAKNSGAAVADLVDLELALNNLQQGLSQMEKMTPSNPYVSKDDPFGDSFVYPPVSSQPILPPPPSSGKERSRTSDSSNIFSPKLTHRATIKQDDHQKKSPTLPSKELKDLAEQFTFPREFSSSMVSTDRSVSDDWFAATDKFDDSLVLPDQHKDDKHEQAKHDIMSQFDVFTELDPLGTGRSKPYIDKKYFFQELKNPPKKALNELASSSSTVNQEFFTAGVNHLDNGKKYSSNVFNNDPFGEDPFVKDDPFANSDFSKQDPFNSEFALFPTSHIANNWEKGAPINQINSKSPKLTSFDPEPSTVNPKGYFADSQLADAHFDKKLQEIPNLDISSGSESTPEPPPRPASTLAETKPPPLPPKKLNDLLVKPPPRPPHTDDSRYDYIVGASEPVHKKITTEVEKGPPLPIPLRKSKFESDPAPCPDRPVKKLTTLSSDEDYLTPITIPNNHDKDVSSLDRNVKKSIVQKPKDAIANNPIEGLDVSLSQLTLNGLNELAAKLNIPSSQLSNMTLAQLASYISNFIKEKANEQEKLHEQNKAAEFPKFEADFSAFDVSKSANYTTGPTSSSTYDKYAVFRELQEEINQISKTEPQVERKDTFEEDHFEDKFEDSVQELNSESNEIKIENSADDKYAALREIVEKEIISESFKQNEPVPFYGQDSNKENNVNSEGFLIDNRLGSNLSAVTPEEEIKTKESTELSLNKSTSPLRSPAKSPVLKGARDSPSVIRDPLESNRVTSGSLSDVVSGSSPEIDNTGSNSDNPRKETNTDLGESWAVFDSNAPPSESLKENLCAVQSEEGVSPWSSDSKEFGNTSPVEWRKKKEAKQWKSKKDQDGWWDSSAEPEVVGFYNPSNRRSTDSYEEEYYECYEKPRRPRRQWQHGQHPPAGGHSSSSRDVSPWDEEPNRREGWSRHSKGSLDRHRDRRTDSWDEEDDYEYEDESRPRGHYFERHSSRDSERRSSGGSRDLDKERWIEGRGDDRRHRRRREGQREMTRGEIIEKDRWCCVDWKRGDRSERDRPERERPDRDRTERDRLERDRPERDIDKSRRYPRKPALDRRERHDDRYTRESQESPWEDEYDPESRHYLSVGNRKSWKQRPSSASEMERKSAELKARGHLGTGGSDGEKDRRYKGARRSRSRDSHYAEPLARHKPETSSTRSQYRNKTYSRTLDYGEVAPKKQIPEGTGSLKKNITSKQERSRKTKEESPRDSTAKSITSTSLPRKNSADRSKSVFEADYEPTKESPSPSQWEGGKFDFEVEFLPESGSVIAHKKDAPNLPSDWQTFTKPPSIEKETEKIKQPSYRDQRRPQKSRSPFEDDFSPSEKMMEGNGISSIKEETDVAEDTEDDNRYATSKTTEPQRKIVTTSAKPRLSSSGRINVNLSKSESVNIFSMENDPFDDEFFSQPLDEMKTSRDVDYSWTDRFQEYGTRRK